MENVAKPKRTTEVGREKSLKERAFGELEKYAVITAYLWLMFALFSLHKQWSRDMGSACGSRASPS